MSKGHAAAPAFEQRTRVLPLATITPMKALRPGVKNSAKYKQILASAQAVGAVEPPAVVHDPSQPGHWLLLDGHLRVEALRDLGHAECVCLIARDDEAYTYNKRINRLSAAQENKMVRRAIEKGVPAERLAAALGLDASAIARRARLLNGIAPEAGELLRDAPCPMATFDVLRQMMPLRQIDVAEMMVAQGNYSAVFARAMLSATPPDQLAPVVRKGGRKAADPAVREQVKRLERELLGLQTRVKTLEESYAINNLNLTVVRGYLKRLLERPAIVEHIRRVRPEYLPELQTVAELSSLPAATDKAA